jgi:hypothetical protein
MVCTLRLARTLALPLRVCSTSAEKLTSRMIRIPQRVSELPVTWSGGQPRSASDAAEVLKFAEWARRVAPLDGSLSWLTPLDEHVRDKMDPYFRDGESRDQLAARFEKTVEEATARGLRVPEAFLKLMRSRELRRRVPSCSCYFDAPNCLIETGDGGVLWRFLNDQQWCMLWYLYLGTDGSEAVVASWHALDVMEAEGEELDVPDVGPGDPGIWVCAPDFEAFLFRFWLENNIGFVKYDAHRAMTEVEKEFVRQGF